MARVWVTWRYVCVARARVWCLCVWFGGGRWHGGKRERTGGCMERVTPQHPVRRLAARFKPINEVPTTHAAKAFAVAAVEDDRVARLCGQAQWRRRLWRRLARAPEALVGRPVHWRGGAIRSVESRFRSAGCAHSSRGAGTGAGPSKGGRVASAWPRETGQAAPYSRQRHLGPHMLAGCAHLQLDLGLCEMPAHRAAVVEAVLHCDRHKQASKLVSETVSL